MYPSCFRFGPRQFGGGFRSALGPPLPSLAQAHFPYIDSLWFGENFNPDASPEEWLVEMSGVLFGLHSEQLASGVRS